MVLADPAVVIAGEAPVGFSFLLRRLHFGTGFVPETYNAAPAEYVG
jgi:hypothetical protein